MGFLLATRRRICCIHCRSMDVRVSPSSTPSMDFFGEIVRMNIRGRNATDLGQFSESSNETEEYFNQLKKAWDNADIVRRKHWFCPRFQFFHSFCFLPWFGWIICWSTFYWVISWRKPLAWPRKRQLTYSLFSLYSTLFFGKNPQS